MTLTKARNAQIDDSATVPKNESTSGKSHERAQEQVISSARDSEEEIDDNDEFGPMLPKSRELQGQARSGFAAKELALGPTIPTYQDLQSREEDARAAAERSREAYAEDVRYERKVDRKLQKSRLDEIVPRAEAGTRERQLEKKREVADSNRAFAASKEAGGDVEIRDSDLMGGDDLGELKRMKKEQDRRKTEREIKREEILRARMAERGQKLKAVRDKEEKTMSMLREIARERFGDGNEQPATLRDQ